MRRIIHKYQRFIHIKKWMTYKKTDSSTKKRYLIPKKEIKIAEKERYPQNFINKKKRPLHFYRARRYLKIKLTF